MQRIVQRLSCLLLALALVLTGPGGAGPAQGAMLVELCAGDSSSEIWIDADGNPVNPAERHGKCVYCLGLSAPIPDAFEGPLAPDYQRRPAGPSLPALLYTPPIAYLRSLPRGPPTVVSEDLRYGDLRPDTRSRPLLAQLSLDSHQAKAPTGVTELRATL